MGTETPEELLEEIGRREDEAATLRRLVADFAPERIREALRGRVGDLWNSAAEILLRTTDGPRLAAREELERADRLRSA